MKASSSGTKRVAEKGMIDGSRRLAQFRKSPAESKASIMVLNWACWGGDWRRRGENGGGGRTETGEGELAVGGRDNEAGLRIVMEVETAAMAVVERRRRRRRERNRRWEAIRGGVLGRFSISWVFLAVVEKATQATPFQHFQ